MFDNREHLQQLGVFYPAMEFGQRPENRKHAAVFQALSKGGKEAQACLTRLCNAFAESGADTMVISEEALGAMAGYNPGSLKPLAALKDTFELEAICFVRRPDTFLESMWNQRCREGSTSKHIGAFCKKPNWKQYIQYDKFLSKWSKTARLHVLGYETIEKSDLFGAFARAIDIPQLPVSPVKNVSPSMTCAAVLAALQRTTSDRYNWRQIEEDLGPNTRKTALGGRLRRKILADFSKQKGILRRKYGVTFPTDLPDEPQDMLSRPDETELAYFRAERFILQPAEPKAS
ncbi:MAG: hypothetical protein AB3N13_12865 [Arenibacterium sp.]